MRRREAQASPAGRSVGSDGVVMVEMQGSGWDMVLAARALAIEAHGDQRRRYVGDYYWVHLAEVARAVTQSVHGRDPEVVAAAWLHDVLEDTPLAPAMIVRTCSSRVLAMVETLTEPAPSPGFNRAARKAEVRARLAAADAPVQTIKVADLLSNLPSIVAHDRRFAPVFLSEARALFEVLHLADADLRDRLAGRLEAGPDAPPVRAGPDSLLSWQAAMTAGHGR